MSEALSVNISNKMRFNKELLAPRPTPKLEDNPLSAVRDCLFSIFAATLHIGGPRWHSAVLQIGRSLVRSQLVSLDFFIDIKSFRSHYGPGVDSASNRIKYQEYFLGVKAAGA